MQKFQCLLFVLKRSYFCCYVILMTEPLIISTDTTINWLFHVFNFSSTKSWLTVKLSSKSLMTSFNCFIESEFTLFLVRDYSGFHWTCCCFFQSSLKLTFHVHHITDIFFIIPQTYQSKFSWSASLNYHLLWLK